MKGYNTLKPSSIRRENIKQIIKLFLDTGKLYSRAQLSRALSLSAPTITTIINDLIAVNILFESKEGNSSRMGGRKPMLLDLNKESGFILGVNLVYNNRITLVISNITGEIKAINTYTYKLGKDQCLGFLIEKMDEFLIDNKIDKKKLLSIGISVPAYYDTELKTIKYGPNIQMWKGIPIKEALEEAFNTEVIIENAVNSAVLGEKWKGKISSIKNAVYVKIDKGIGAGILIEGQLYKGYKNIAGEIGSMVVDQKMLPGEKNLYGAMEKNFSTKAIIEKANKLTARNDLEFTDIVEYIQNGYDKIYSLVKGVSREIAIGIANIICVLSPEVVVFGGEFTPAAEIFLEDIKSIINLIVLEPPQIVLSELGEQVYYMGAIFQALNGIEDNLIKKCFDYS